MKITRLLACLLIGPAAPFSFAQTDARSVEPLLEPRIQPENVTAYELRRYIARRIPELHVPAAAEQWTAQAKQLRSRLLNEIVFHGWPREWVESAPKFQDLGVFASGPGYRIRKLRYEIVPGFESTAVLYEPETIRGRIPAILERQRSCGAGGKSG